MSQASVAGIYDYFSFGTGMSAFPQVIDRTVDPPVYGVPVYGVSRNSYRGTLVFGAGNTVTINGTGEYTSMQMTAADGPSKTWYVSTNTDPDTGTQPYTVSGSTVTIANGMAVGTLSADGKILIMKFKSSNTGIMIGIKRPPTIMSATSSTADGHYNAGASINITLNFSEAVTSTGLTITLNSGATITTGTISNAPSWSGTYTVGTGQTSSDLSISTITGTITAVMSTTNPTIPEGQNIGDSKAIIIE